jgi:hypothetical protein
MRRDGAVAANRDRLPRDAESKFLADIRDGGESGEYTEEGRFQWSWYLYRRDIAD